MANWDRITIREAVTRIRDETLVLPVIQRRLVWDKDKMALLFDTVLRSNSFGGVMSIEEEKGACPIFAFREFTTDGSPVQSKQVLALTRSHNLVIDGQQRLQTFYIGLCGSFNGRQLHFDLYSDHQENDFNFRFARTLDVLPREDDEKQHVKECYWYSVKSLFEMLDVSQDDDLASDEIAAQANVSDPEKTRCLKRNLRLFYNNIFSQMHVGIARVSVSGRDNITKSRQKIVELFRRLNDGGTRLSAFDLAASIMKGFDWQMEAFLDELLTENRALGLTQDNLLKLIFLLRDNHSKEMMDIDEHDAHFAVDNRERISAALASCTQFLRFSNLLAFYADSRPSFIPVFFVTYHLYHSSVPTSQLVRHFDNYDTANSDYRLIYKWLMLSLLNGVFRSRGAGWIPYKTGIRKILQVMRRHRGGVFPYSELIDTYYTHPLNFTEEVNENTLSVFDTDIVLFMLYNLPRGIREQDRDHIQPWSLLWKNPEHGKVASTIENYQLLDAGTNRGVKNAKPLDEWLASDVSNREIYLEKHFIPGDPNLWKIERYLDFIEARRKLLVAALRARLYLHEP